MEKLFLPFLIFSAAPAAHHIDDHISISHVSGIYPQINDGTYLEDGAEKALELGFQNIEVYLNPSVCLVRNNPAVIEGIYQNAMAEDQNNWCNNTHYTNGDQNYELKYKFSTLTNLVSRNIHYKKLLNLPFKTMFLTIDPISYKRSAYSILMSSRNKSGDVIPFNKTQIDNLYKEVYDLAVYLLTQKGIRVKRFVMISGNEIDWALLGGAGHPDKNPDSIAINNAIQYWNTVQLAIDNAKKRNTNSKVEIYQACEVNLLMKSINGGITATNNVVPNTHCDLYGYSAYDATIPSKGYKQSNLEDAVNYLKLKAPDSRKFGKNNVFISEIGLPERDYNPTEHNFNANKKNIDVFKGQIEVLLRMGVPYINIWTLYDNECSKFGTITDDFSKSGCPGFWMIKPSGKTSSTYQMIESNFSYGNVTQKKR